MTKTPTFAIITDFGFDFSVASMKALILCHCPDARIIDIDHSIERFSILSAAFVLDKVYQYFPDNTIFICVIDPGVGSRRDIFCVETKKYKFIGPNNGIFHYILKNNEIDQKIYKVKDNFTDIPSNTFHGRDIITPVAIELAKGNHSFFEPVNKKDIVFIPALESGTFIILYIDGFGNIKTNISVDTNYIANSKILTLKINNIFHEIRFVKTFSDVENGELLCYKGSNNTIEIAVNLGSAKDALSVKVGDIIYIE